MLQWRIMCHKNYGIHVNHVLRRQKVLCVKGAKRSQIVRKSVVGTNQQQSYKTFRRFFQFDNRIITKKWAIWTSFQNDVDCIALLSLTWLDNARCVQF